MASSGLGQLTFERSYAGRRVLVTGHTGFTGGWLASWLNSIGAEVHGLALEATTTPNLCAAAGIERLCHSMIGDIRDFGTVKEAFAAARPEVVFHLAAQPLVSRSFDDPLETIATNVLGTATILEAARSTAQTRAVVCITTDKVYKDQAWPWGYRETDVLGGKDPYSASKACAELVAASYASSLAAAGNGVHIATARGGNIIGGGDWSDNRIVPDFVRAAVGGSALTIRNPQAVRPWQHVLALAHGYLMLGDRLLRGDLQGTTWNLGPSSGEAKPVSDLLAALQSHWRKIEIRHEAGAFPETHFLHLDSSKARRELGWCVPLEFEQTVKLTVEWYRGYYDAPDAARQLTEAQIARYRADLVEAV